jgi:hypothetical protein
MSLLMSVPPNLVQSIRAFRVAELQEEAARLGSTSCMRTASPV